MKKLMKLCTVSMLSLAVLAGCSSTGEKSDQKKITVLTNSGYAPYEVRDTSGNLEGFDVDLMNAIAEKKGYEIEWKDIDFDALIGALQAGQGDLVIAGMSPDPKRAEEVDFSEIYYQSEADTTNFVLCKDDGSIESTEDIKGKTVGVQIGTIQETAVNEIKDGYSLNIDSRKNYGDMVQEIKNGRIDFVVVEQAIGEKYMENNEGMKMFKLETESTNSTGNAIAYKKGSALKAEIDEVIKEMKDNGEMQKLIDKWFQAE